MPRHSDPNPNNDAGNASQNLFGPRAYSVTEACQRLGGISRSTFYRLVEKRDLAVRKLGSRTVVMAAEVERYLYSLPPSR